MYPSHQWPPQGPVYDYPAYWKVELAGAAVKNFCPRYNSS
jgi:hypothetical protein